MSIYAWPLVVALLFLAALSASVRRLGTGAFTLFFLLFLYFSYSFVWSSGFIRGNIGIEGSVAAVAFDSRYLALSYVMLIGALGGSLAVAAIPGGPGRAPAAGPRNEYEWRISFCASLGIAALAVVSMLRTFQEHGLETVWSRNASSNDPLGYVCQHLFSLPLAVAWLWGNRRCIGIGAALYALTLGIGLFSGRTTFIVVGSVPLLLAAVERVETRHWRRVFPVLLATLLVGGATAQVFRYMRLQGSADKQFASSVNVQNSFIEGLIFSYVIERVTHPDDHLGLAPFQVALYSLLPESVGGETKKELLSRYRVDSYVGTVYFKTKAPLPITIFGEGYLAFGVPGVAVVSVLVGTVLATMRRLLRRPSTGFASAAILASAVVWSSRMGLVEIAVVCVAGVGMIAAGKVVWRLLIPLRAAPPARLKRPVAAPDAARAPEDGPGRRRP